MNARRKNLLTAGAVLVTVIAPLAMLVVQAFADQWHAPAILPQAYGTRGLHAVLDDPNLAAGITNSFFVALAATAVALVLGWPVARLVSATRHRAFGVGLLVIPLLIPQAAIGTGLSTWFLRLHLAGSLTGLTAAHLVQVLPYVTVALLTGFTPQLAQNEEAADSLGATALERFGHVTLPAMVPTAALAAALGFIVSWSQYGTSLVVGSGTPMLPLTMVPYLRHDPQIAAVLTLFFIVPPALAGALALRGTRQADRDVDPEAFRAPSPAGAHRAPNGPGCNPFPPPNQDCHDRTRREAAITP